MSKSVRLFLATLAFALTVAAMGLSLATALLLCRNGAPAATALFVLCLGAVGAICGASAAAHFGRTAFTPE